MILGTLSAPNRGQVGSKRARPGIRQNLWEPFFQKMWLQGSFLGPQENRKSVKNRACEHRRTLWLENRVCGNIKPIQGKRLDLQVSIFGNQGPKEPPFSRAQANRKRAKGKQETRNKPKKGSNTPIGRWPGEFLLVYFLFWHFIGRPSLSAGLLYRSQPYFVA